MNKEERKERFEQKHHGKLVKDLTIEEFKEFTLLCDYAFTGTCAKNWCETDIPKEKNPENEKIRALKELDNQPECSFQNCSLKNDIIIFM